MLDWSAMHWKVEPFHETINSDCWAEETKLQSAEQLVNLLSLDCIVSWPIFWMMMLNRVMPDVPPRFAPTALDIDLLDGLVRDRDQTSPVRKKLPDHWNNNVCMGGRLGRA